MDERVAQVRMGVVVLATLFVGTILTLLFVEMPSIIKGTKTLYFRYRHAPGVSVETPVRKSGIRIGKVTHIELIDTGALITAEVDDDVKLRVGEAPRITTNLLGDAIIEFVPGPNLVDDLLRNGDTITGEVAPDLLRLVANLEEKMGRTIESLGEAGDDVSQLAQNLNNILGGNDEQFSRIVSKTERTLDSFDAAMSSINAVMGDPQMQADIRRGLSDLPKLLSDMHKTVQQLNTAMELAESNLRNVEGFTKPLGQRGDEIIANMNSGVRQLDRLLTQLADFSTNLNTGEGSLGKLLNDPRLYQQLNEAAQNINELTSEIRPIVADARVFTDKIARHPEVLTRGIISPSSGIKGVSPRVLHSHYETHD